MSEKPMRHEFEAVIARIEERIKIQTEKEDKGWHQKLEAEERINRYKKNLHSAEMDEHAGARQINEAQAELSSLNEELDVMKRAMESACVGE